MEQSAEKLKNMFNIFCQCKQIELSLSFDDLPFELVENKLIELLKGLIEIMNSPKMANVDKKLFETVLRTVGLDIALQNLSDVGWLSKHFEISGTNNLFEQLQNGGLRKKTSKNKYKQKGGAGCNDDCEHNDDCDENDCQFCDQGTKTCRLTRRRQPNPPAPSSSGEFGNTYSLINKTQERRKKTTADILSEQLEKVVRPTQNLKAKTLEEENKKKAEKKEKTLERNNISTLVKKIEGDLKEKITKDVNKFISDDWTESWKHAAIEYGLSTASGTMVGVRSVQACLTVNSIIQFCTGKGTNFIAWAVVVLGLI